MLRVTSTSEALLEAFVLVLSGEFLSSFDSLILDLLGRIISVLLGYCPQLSRTIMLQLSDRDSMLEVFHQFTSFLENAVFL